MNQDLTTIKQYKSTATPNFLYLGWNYIRDQD